ncbi:MAG: leucyl/phenylalanyl-tRNA--protein transferase [Bacteroidetes bacterium]|nr:leucyl/phenylalanyl-tRNA--protein transferase [Bacteroidota bacterium]
MLTAHQVLHGYSQGIFPMAEPEEDNEIYWYEPTLRGIILPEEFKVSKNLLKEYRKEIFQLYKNKNFKATITACSKRDETWISDEIIEVYCGLHKMGYAHSFEAWQDGQLVGGLYGVAIGKVFFGESMFHTVTNASKIGLMFLLDWINTNDFVLVDCQFMTEHLKQFGAKEISQKDYLLLLENALKIK